MLFAILAAAEQGRGRDAVLIALGSAILAALMKLAEFVWGGISEGRKSRKEELGKVEGHLERLVARLEADKVRAAAKAKRLRHRIRALENSNTQMRVYISRLKGRAIPPYVEIPLDPDDDDEGKPDTDAHEPLSLDEGADDDSRDKPARGIREGD